jgi:uncharacterized protein
VKRLFLSLSILAMLNAFHASAVTPEIEEAYKQGAADWDRGDPASAMVPLKKAADAGHAAAQALYGYMLDQADSDVEAAEYYRKAVVQGNADGMFWLGGLYVAGDGVKQDLLEARRLFVQAAELGHKQAVVVLSLAYMQGGLGLSTADKQSADALKWLREAAKADHVPSLTRLVEVYQKGEMGVTPDKAEADRLQKRVHELLGTDPNAPKKRRRRV